MSKWQPIETYDRSDYEKVDLWLHIYASPRSMGFSDSFRVIEAYQINGKWFHIDGGKEKELYGPYITHWMPLPEPPEEG